ncbi:MAG: hypothetical protein ABSB35_39040, partial [Bryobacteraceae bacterium]
MRLTASARFVLNYEVESRRRVHMDSEWIDQRLKSYQDKRSIEDQQRRWETKAHDAFKTYFEQLVKRIEEDVKIYNEKFAAYEDCAVTFRPIGSVGCSVQGKEISVKIMKQDESCVIAVEYETNQAKKTNTHFEVGPDERGSVTYKDSSGNVLTNSRDPANPGEPSR